MTFEKLIELFLAEDIPLESIIFKAPWMEHWYVPKTIGGYGEGRKLVCLSPTRKDTARFDWSDSSNIKPHTVLEVKVDCGTKSLTSPSGSKVRIFLQGVKHL